MSHESPTTPPAAAATNAKFATQYAKGKKQRQNEIKPEKRVYLFNFNFNVKSERERKN